MGGVAKYGGPYGMVRGIGTDARFWDLRTKNVGERRSVVEGEYLARLAVGFGVADDERRRKDRNEGDSFGGYTAFISGALRLFMNKTLPLSRREPSVSNRISEKLIILLGTWAFDNRPVLATELWSALSRDSDRLLWNRSLSLGKQCERLRELQEEVWDESDSTASVSRGPAVSEAFSGDTTDVREPEFSTCRIAVGFMSMGIAAVAFCTSTVGLGDTSAKYTRRAVCGSIARVARMGVRSIGATAGRIRLETSEVPVVIDTFVVRRGGRVGCFALVNSKGKDAPTTDVGRSHVNQTANKLCNALDSVEHVTQLEQYSPEQSPSDRAPGRKRKRRFSGMHPSSSWTRVYRCSPSCRCRSLQCHHVARQAFSTSGNGVAQGH
jgi:hypothetical protein